MVTKEDLRVWVFASEKANGGQATIAQVCKHVWENHEAELRQSGDLFYTWGYDIRWAAQALRDAKLFKDNSLCKRGVWEIAEAATAAAVIP